MTNAIYFAKISAIIIGADEKEYFGAWLKRADEGARSASSTEERHFGAINFKADTYVSSRVEPRVILVPADIVGRVFLCKSLITNQRSVSDELSGNDFSLEQLLGQ